jgi:hypothetical protein
MRILHQEKELPLLLDEDEDDAPNGGGNEEMWNGSRKRRCS